MPFTPFHLGPALLSGFILLGYLDLPTFIVASVLVDLEPLAVLVFGLPGPLHGFFHSLLGASVAAALLAWIMLRVKGFLEPIYVFLRLEGDRRPRKFLVAALLGTWTHVLLDTPLYGHMRPFYPFGGNPLFGVDLYLGLGAYRFCLLSGVAGVALFVSRYIRARTHPRSDGDFPR
jgi:membrane-bound metal-dependent hydrolase YbcI (DUF457 family)